MRKLPAIRIFPKVLQSSVFVQCNADWILMFVFKVTDCLTTVKSINKTDSITLLSTFSVSTTEQRTVFSLHYLLCTAKIHPQVEAILSSVYSQLIICLFHLVMLLSDVLIGNDPFLQSVEGIISASKEDLVLCPGLGPQKVSKNTHAGYEYTEAQWNIW